MEYDARRTLILSFDHFEKTLAKLAAQDQDFLYDVLYDILTSAERSLTCRDIHLIYRAS